MSLTRDLCKAAERGSTPTLRMNVSMFNSKHGATKDAALPADIIDAIDSSSGLTPLMTAARAGVAEAVDFLVTAGATTDVQEPMQGRTALMIAIAADKADACRALASWGADQTTIQCVTGETAADLASNEVLVSDAVRRALADGATRWETKQHELELASVEKQARKAQTRLATLRVRQADAHFRGIVARVRQVQRAVQNGELERQALPDPLGVGLDLEPVRALLAQALEGDSEHAEAKALTKEVEQFLTKVETQAAVASANAMASARRAAERAKFKANEGKTVKGSETSSSAKVDRLPLSSMEAVLVSFKVPFFRALDFGEPASDAQQTSETQGLPPLVELGAAAVSIADDSPDSFLANGRMLDSKERGTVQLVPDVGIVFTSASDVNTQTVTFPWSENITFEVGFLDSAEVSVVEARGELSNDRRGFVLRIAAASEPEKCMDIIHSVGHEPAYIIRGCQQHIATLFPSYATRRALEERVLRIREQSRMGDLVHREHALQEELVELDRELATVGASKAAAGAEKRYTDAASLKQVETALQAQRESVTAQLASVQNARASFSERLQVMADHLAGVAIRAHERIGERLAGVRAAEKAAWEAEDFEYAKHVQRTADHLAHEQAKSAAYLAQYPDLQGASAAAAAAGPLPAEFAPSAPAWRASMSAPADSRPAPVAYKPGMMQAPDPSAPVMYNPGMMSMPWIADWTDSSEAATSAAANVDDVTFEFDWPEPNAPLLGMEIDSSS